MNVVFPKELKHYIKQNNQVNYFLNIISIFVIPSFIPVIINFIFYILFYDKVFSRILNLNTLGKYSFQVCLPCPVLIMIIIM